MKKIDGLDWERSTEFFFFRLILVTSNDWSKVWDVMCRSIGRKQALQGRYDGFSDWMKIQFRTDIKKRNRSLPVQATIVMFV